MNIESLSRKAASIALTLAIMAPIAATAQPFEATGLDQSPTVTVKYGDLDLSRPEAVAVLYRRVQSAAKTTCARFDGKDLGQLTLLKACVDHAIATAVHQVNQPALSALYAANTGNKQPNLVVASSR